MYVYVMYNINILLCCNGSNVPSDANNRKRLQADGRAHVYLCNRTNHKIYPSSTQFN